MKDVRDHVCMVPQPMGVVERSSLHPAKVSVTLIVNPKKKLPLQESFSEEQGAAAAGRSSLNPAKVSVTFVVHRKLIDHFRKVFLKSRVLLLQEGAAFILPRFV